MARYCNLVWIFVLLTTAIWTSPLFAASFSDDREALDKLLDAGSRMLAAGEFEDAEAACLVGGLTG